jgi:hypothetical protein
MAVRLLSLFSRIFLVFPGYSCYSEGCFEVTRIFEPMKIEQLRQQLIVLTNQVTALQQAGTYLVGVRIERSPAGGTASLAAKEACRYARLRAGKGKLLPNGKKSQYIPVESISQYEAACARGKQIQQLERQIERIRAQIWKIEQTQYRSWSRKARTPRATKVLNQPVVNPVEPPSRQLFEVNLSPLESPPAAILVLYRQSPTTPVHAVAAEVWQGNQKVLEIRPVHCMGMRADKVTEYIKQLLASLTQQFGITRFEDTVKEVPVEWCPIDPCPLRNESTA